MSQLYLQYQWYYKWHGYQNGHFHKKNLQYEIQQNNFKKVSIFVMNFVNF